MIKSQELFVDQTMGANLLITMSYIIFLKSSDLTLSYYQCGKYLSSETAHRELPVGQNWCTDPFLL